MDFFSKRAIILIGAAVLYFQYQIYSGKKTEASAQNITSENNQLSGREYQVKNMAKETTVLITRPNTVSKKERSFAGSGVIVARSGKKYYVLTAKHVVELMESYTVVTPDGKHHKVDDTFHAKKLDLGVLQFKSKRKYDIASIGNSDSLSTNSLLYLSGWVKSENEPRFTAGKITELRRNYTATEGYSLIYDNNAHNGMSGGPLLSENGCLVGIHGRRRAIQGWGIILGEKNKNRYLGIPINEFENNPPEAINWNNLERDGCSKKNQEAVN